VQRHEPGLVEFRLGDGEQPVSPVDVGAVESQGLTDPQPGHHQQPDESLESGRPQREPPQRVGGCHQPGDVVG